MREALDVIDAMILETAQAASRMHLAAPQDFDRLNAGTGVGIRIQTLKDAKDRLLTAGINRIKEPQG
jgi:hypothetical protein